MTCNLLTSKAGICLGALDFSLVIAYPCPHKGRKPHLDIVMEKFDFSDSDIQKRLVAENGLAFAFLNKMPIVPGHILVCPKRPVSTSEEVTFDEWKDLLSLKEIVCTKLKKALQAKGFNFAWNEDLVAGQTVPHFHLHVVPRKEGDAGIVEYEPRVFLYRPGSRADSPREELIIFSNELQKL